MKLSEFTLGEANIQLKTEKDYYEMQKKLQQVEKRINLYLTDFNVDAENSEDFPRESDEWWDSMYRSMCMAAGARAEEEGQDINKLLGITIY